MVKKSAVPAEELGFVRDTAAILAVRIFLIAWSPKLPTLRALASYLRCLGLVVRLLDHGSPEQVNALLGCPIHLPSENDRDVEDIMTLPLDKKRAAQHSIYYAVQW